ncbi:TonB-dependent receptor plug domain-containing protein [Propionivibrio dicarboxylicus]|uniref:Vitamin B12 transporter n=1 Tax=Propionivibrio dicarboxylicus TaxID=83767 RepID=A0A1G8EPL2_9RHOO|nr:TonB-dependent receptor [Propionivibrio dicarboxylicus]SDH71820.1 vitamin B12 transporter [Propionivibrio dicarboxylicus]
MSKRIIFAAIPAALTFSGAVVAEDAGMREMVVTANRTQEAKRELSSNVTIINEADIKASTASTLADLMTQQGLMVVTTGDSSGVQMRGYGSLTMMNEPENTVLMLINGRRVGSANLGFMGLANVERVEIIRGPSAVQYGSSALGGVINVITKQGTANKPYASIELGAGSNGLVREKMAAGGAVGNFDFALGLTNFTRNDISTSEFGKWYHTDTDHNTMGTLDLGYTIAKNHRVGLNYYQGDVASNLPTGYIRSAGSNTPSSTYNSYRKMSENTTLSYTGSTDDKVYDWSASYTTGREDNQYKTSTPPYTNFIETQMLNGQAGYNGSLWSLSVGIDSLEYHNYASNAPAKPTMADHGAYFSSKLRLLDERLIFSVGGRYDKYTNTSVSGTDYTDSHFGGSYGVAWLPVEGLKLRTNYAEGFKMPSPRQVGGSSPYYNANPNLQPEKGKTWEIGADFDWKSMAASLTYFHSSYENKIVGMAVTGMPLSYQWQNIKAATLAGMEGSLRYDLGKALGKSWSLTPFGSFTWLGTRKTTDSSQFYQYNGSTTDILANTPEWMFSYGVDYANPGYKLKSRLSANTYGTVLTKDYSKTGSPYIQRPSGTVANLSLEKELVELSNSNGTLTLRAEINNLFDGKNEMYWNYPGQGRNFYAGIRYDYK